MDENSAAREGLISVELKVNPYPEEKVLPVNGLYRYLYQTGKLENESRWRATFKDVWKAVVQVIQILVPQK